MHLHFVHISTSVDIIKHVCMSLLTNKKFNHQLFNKKEVRLWLHMLFDILLTSEHVFVFFSRCVSWEQVISSADLCTSLQHLPIFLVHSSCSLRVFGINREALPLVLVTQLFCPLRISEKHISFCMGYSQYDKLPDVALLL